MALGLRNRGVRAASRRRTAAPPANPIAFTTLTSGNSTSNVGSYATASVTPTANRLYIFAAFLTGTNPIPDFNITGNGLTWEVAANSGMSARGQKIWVAKGTPTAGAVTISAASGTYTSAGWHMVQVDGLDLTGANAMATVVQSVNDRPASTNSASVPFLSPVSATNGAFAMIAMPLAETITPGTGWTGFGAQTWATPNSASVGMTATSSPPQNITGTWTTAAIPFVAGIELKKAA